MESLEGVIMNKVRLAYCPTRRDVFSREEAIKFNGMIREQMEAFDVEIIDLEGVNEEKLLYPNTKELFRTLMEENK